MSGVLIPNSAAVTVGCSLGQGISACPANEGFSSTLILLDHVGCPHAKEALRRGSHDDPAGRQISRCRSALRSCTGGHRAAAAGALGLAAKGTVQGFDEIPASLKTPPLSQRTTILDANNDPIATVYERDRTVVKLKDISPYMQKALVAIEDARFYEHGAVDLKGVLRAVNRNAQEGGAAQGASTLTQQYVKNVFVEEAGDDPTKVAQAQQEEPRAQGPRAEVRDPGRGVARQEEDP